MVLNICGATPWKTSGSPREPRATLISIIVEGRSRVCEGTVNVAAGPEPEAGSKIGRAHV